MSCEMNTVPEALVSASGAARAIHPEEGEGCVWGGGGGGRGGVRWWGG